ncbi:MAG: hypothetical protein Q4G21_09585 [Dermabacter sp.]|nr:hypothetical protein [Dermabacter sp.]
MSTDEHMADEHALERRARATVISRTVYKGVVTLWVVSAAGMLAIWWLTTPGGYFWVIWPVLGMSTAALIWGLAIYGKPPFRVRRDQVEREVARLRARQS